MISQRQAVNLFAVVGLCLWLSGGCAMKRDVVAVQLQVEEVKQAVRENSRQLNQLDSISRSEAEANKILRNDMHVSMAELQKEITQLLAAYQDLSERIDILTSRAVTPRSNPSIPIPPDSLLAQSSDCDTLYDAAFSIMHAQKYEEALTKFSNFVVSCPVAAQVSDAQYWIGECLFSLAKFKDALDTLQNFTATFPASVHLPQAMYKVGRCYQELKMNRQARLAFDKVIKQFPRTQEAENAHDRLREMKK